MYDAVLLNVGAVFYGDSAPVSAQYRAWADVHVAANPNISRHISLGMNESGRVDHGAHAVKRVKHLVNLKVYTPVHKLLALHPRREHAAEAH